MSYNYITEKPALFTNEGQRVFLKIRDKANNLLKLAGAARMQELMNVGCSGSSWQFMACVDRLVELGEIMEIPQSNIMTQHRVFVAPYTD